MLIELCGNRRLGCADPSRPNVAFQPALVMCLEPRLAPSGGGAPLKVPKNVPPDDTSAAALMQKMAKLFVAIQRQIGSVQEDGNVTHYTFKAHLTLGRIEKLERLRSLALQFSLNLVESISKDNQAERQQVAQSLIVINGVNQDITSLVAKGRERYAR